MIVGYVLLGTLAGVFAVMVHLVTGDGSVFAAVLLFYATCTLTLVIAALWVALREARQEQRLQAIALAAPVPALYRPGAPDSPAGRHPR